MVGIFVIFIACTLILYPVTVKGDVGPKPSLKVVAKNMPAVKCYLDLLVNYPLEKPRTNLRAESKYDQTMLNMLKSYNVDGWRPAMVTGTRVPLWGDIECNINKNGECIIQYAYMGIPDRFKIIVVSADGKTVVSNDITREGFDGTVIFDYQAGSVAEHFPVWSYIKQFAVTFLATIIVEGLILLLFRFSLRQNWKPFLAINVLTQVLLTIAVFWAMYKSGIMLAGVLYLLCELVIFVLEAFLFAKFLRQHSRARRVVFSLTANLVSFFLGVFLLMNPLQQLSYYILQNY